MREVGNEEENVKEETVPGRKVGACEPLLVYYRSGSMTKLKIVNGSHVAG